MNRQTLELQTARRTRPRLFRTVNVFSTIDWAWKNEMRLFFLVLASIIGLNPAVTNAGTLVGGWYLEETEGASVDVRRAISQPVVQSLEANQVTLGIKSPGVVDPVDFFVIVSGDASNSGCTYTVSEIAIDAETFPVSSSAHSSDITQITTRLADTQKRLWRAFRKGQNLSLSVRQICGDQRPPVDAVTSHAFSLKGSSAAYRFVSGEEVISKPTQPAVQAEKPISHTKTEGTEPTREDDSGDTIYLPWLVALIIVAFIAFFMKRRQIPLSSDAALGPVRKRSGPQSGDYPNLSRADVSARKEPQLKFGTGGNLISETEQAVASLPRYKVERVVDGDTVIVSTFQHKLTIRLSSIDCPEDGQEWGDIARAGLIKIIGGQHVQVETHHSDHYERTVATLYVFDKNDTKWTNVNERMVMLGHAWVMRRYYDHLPKHRQAQLNNLERWAKSKRVGLWKSPNPIAPWKWRQTADT